MPWQGPGAKNLPVQDASAAAWIGMAAMAEIAAIGAYIVEGDLGGGRLCVTSHAPHRQSARVAAASTRPVVPKTAPMGAPGTPGCRAHPGFLSTRGCDSCDSRTSTGVLLTVMMLFVPGRTTDRTVMRCVSLATPERTSDAAAIRYRQRYRTRGSFSNGVSSLDGPAALVERFGPRAVSR